MKDATDRGEHRIVARRCEQRYPEGRSIRMHRRRHGQPTEIKQIHKVGIRSKAAIELDRIRKNLFDGIGRRHRRQDQSIYLAKDVIADAAQLLELIERCKSLDRGRTCPRQNDFARDWMHGFGCGRDQRAGRDIAFGNPWPVVEKPRGLVEPLDIDLNDGDAKPLAIRQGCIIGRSRSVIPEKQALTGHRYTELAPVSNWSESAEPIRP